MSYPIMIIGGGLNIIRHFWLWLKEFVDQNFQVIEINFSNNSGYFTAILKIDIGKKPTFESYNKIAKIQRDLSNLPFYEGLLLRDRLRDIKRKIEKKIPIDWIIIDDDYDVYKELKNLYVDLKSELTFSNPNYAKDPEYAKEKLKEKYDFILLDVHFKKERNLESGISLSPVGGQKIIEVIKKSKMNYDTPIFMISDKPAFTRENEPESEFIRAEFWKKGAIDFFNKTELYKASFLDQILKTLVDYNTEEAIAILSGKDKTIRLLDVISLYADNKFQLNTIDTEKLDNDDKGEKRIIISAKSAELNIPYLVKSFRGKDVVFSHGRIFDEINTIT